MIRPDELRAPWGAWPWGAFVFSAGLRRSRTYYRKMQTRVELPRDYGWGLTRVLAARLERDGYHVTEIRSPQHVLLALTGRPMPHETEMSPLAGRGPLLAPIEGVTAGLEEQPVSAALPVVGALAPLLPGGGLARGSVVAIQQSGLLCLALMAAASQQGMWCAAAGLPDLGMLAAVGTGVEPGRMMLVPEPGQRWAEVTATILDACEVVLLRPRGHVPAQARRRLETAARRSGAALIVAGTWDGAPVRLRVARQQWDGIGDGYGRLRARRAEVVAEGRGAATQPRSRWLWLPGPDGKITAAAGPADSRARGAGEGDWRRTGSG